MLDQLKLRTDINYNDTEAEAMSLRAAFCPIKDLIFPVCIHFINYCPLVAATGYYLWKLRGLSSGASFISIIFVGVGVSPLTKAGASQATGGAPFLDVCALLIILGSLMADLLQLATDKCACQAVHVSASTALKSAMILHTLLYTWPDACGNCTCTLENDFTHPHTFLCEDV